MKTFTNHTAGPRGFNVEGQGTVWLDPGESIKLDPESIVGALPDLGKASDAEPGDTSELGALKVQIADLTKQVESLTGERDAAVKANADLTKQVEALTKPADKK